MTIDLDAYLSRIGHDGPRTPTLDTLRALHALHPRAIPFENLDPWFGRPVELAPAALEDKLVRRARGGYCYEQNGLFGAVLHTLGFRVRGLAARVRWQLAPDVAMPRSHMLLLVELPEGPHVADVGFGLMTLTAPLRFEPDREQPTSHETYRLRAEGAGFVLEARVRGEWRSLYAFDLVEQLPVDYEVLNWYTSTHPSSRFVQHLIAARPTDDGRLALLDRELSRYHLDGRVERRTLAGADELRESLACDFGIDLAHLPDLAGHLPAAGR